MLNRSVLTSLLLLVVTFVPRSHAQTNQPSTSQPKYSYSVNGATSPNSIPDSVAYRMFFLSHVSISLLGLNDADAQVLSNAITSFRSSYKSQVNDFNGSAQTIRNNRESVVAATRATLSQNMSPSGLTTLDAFVQAHKGGISIFSAAPTMTSSASLADVTAATTGSGSFTVSHFEGTANPADGQIQDEEITLDGSDDSGDEPCTDTVVIQNTVSLGNTWQPIVTNLNMSTGNIATGADSGTYYANGSGRVWFYAKRGAMQEITPSNVSICRHRSRIKRKCLRVVRSGDIGVQQHLH